MEKVVEKGYSANYQIINSELSHIETGNTYQAHQVHIVDFSRFEGQTDPADCAILYVLETDDGIMGTIADAYGMYANPEIGEFMVNVHDIHKKNSSA